MSVLKIALIALLVLIQFADTSLSGDIFDYYDEWRDEEESLTTTVAAASRSLDRLAVRSLNRAQKQDQCGWHEARRVPLADRIANGYNALPGEFPSFVQVRTGFRNGQNNSTTNTGTGSERFLEDEVELKAVQTCGGTIISDRLVLTAAHCVKHEQGYPLHDVIVLAGSVDAKQGLKRLRVENVCVTEDGGFNKFDIAVLITSEPIQFGEHIQPACLPGTDLGYEAEAFAVGLGYISNTPAQLAAKQVQVLPVRRLQKCRSNVARDHIMCLVSRDPNYVGDICKEFTFIFLDRLREGDSGGPTYVHIDGRQTVVGVVSGATNRCLAGKSTTSVHENVFVVYDRIKDMVQQCQ